MSRHSSANRMPWAEPPQLLRHLRCSWQRLPAGPGNTHPHVFIDGGADLVFDGEGRLSKLRISWIYDPLTSLFMIEDLGLPATEPLTEAQRAELAAYQTEWHPDFEGDSYVYDGSREIGLSGPQEPDAEIRDGRVVISFTRKLDTPIPPSDQIRVEIYDPTYYTAYAVTEAPSYWAIP